MSCNATKPRANGSMVLDSPSDLKRRKQTMKNLHLLYRAIKNVEEKTLFKFELIDEDNQLHFSYYKEDFKMIVSIENIYIDPEENCVLLSCIEMRALLELMATLKEFN